MLNRFLQYKKDQMYGGNRGYNDQIWDLNQGFYMVSIQGGDQHSQMNATTSARLRDGDGKSSRKSPGKSLKFKTGVWANTEYEI